MDPFSIAMMAMSAAGSIGSMFGPGMPAYTEAPKAPSIGDINSSSQNTEMWKQYQQYKDLGSNYYRTAGQGLRTQMAGMIPSATNLMGMSRKAGIGSGFSTAQANQMRNDMFAKAGAQANQGLLGLYNQGQGLATQNLGMAYDTGTKHQGMVQDRNMANWKAKSEYDMAKYQAGKEKSAAWGKLGGLAGAVVGAGLYNEGNTNSGFWENVGRNFFGKKNS